jgi:hypothetical protein
MNFVLLSEPQPKISFFMQQKRLVVQTNVNQLFGAKHNAASDWFSQTVVSSQNLFLLINQQIVTSDRIHVFILAQKLMQ